MKYWIVLTSLITSTTCFAWGKRGHETVGSLAAQLLAKQTINGRFLLHHSFDMGYYNNAPDIVWKSTDEVYKKEWTQHFIDFEAFDKEFKSRNIENGWSPDRKAFFEKFPIKNNDGRAFWRIQEFYQKLEEISKKLGNKKLKREDRQTLQLNWIVTAGLMGHYFADLSQPLHVTENYDGRSTGQKGIHHWFEESMVDELYPTITNEVYQKAIQRWPQFQKDAQGKTPFQLAIELARDSQKHISKVLEMDQQIGRRSVAIAAEKNKALLIDRLSTGVLYLAYVWNLQTAWGPTYDGERFFGFAHVPAYVDPGAETPQTTETTDKK